MLDVAALQRELDAGVSPDLTEDVAPALSRLPLQDAIEFGSGRTDKSIDQRLAFIEALLEAGASVDATAGGGRTALHIAVSQTDRSIYPANFELIVDRLMQAGADVNALDGRGHSVLTYAARGSSTTLVKLLSAGAVDPRGFEYPLKCALARPRPRNCAVLMRAGAVLTLEMCTKWNQLFHSGDPSARGFRGDPYLRKIVETPGGFLRRNQNCTTRTIDALDDFHTGGFKAYEKAHRQRLTATFLPKFPSLPVEIVSHIVSFGFHYGCY